MCAQGPAETIRVRFLRARVISSCEIPNRLSVGVTRHLSSLPLKNSWRIIQYLIEILYILIFGDFSLLPIFLLCYTPSMGISLITPSILPYSTDFSGLTTVSFNAFFQSHKSLSGCLHRSWCTHSLSRNLSEDRFPGCIQRFCSSWPTVCLGICNKHPRSSDPSSKWEKHWIGSL